MQRPDFFQIVTENRRGNGLLTRLEPVDVATHGIDFAIVGDVAERMRQVPSREGIGRKALVHQSKCRNRPLILKIEVIDTHLISQQQSLVVDCPCRERRHVEFLTVLELERLDGVRSAATDDVELSLQCIGHKDVWTTADKYLADHRFFGFDGRRHRHITIDRNISPTE